MTFTFHLDQQGDYIKDLEMRVNKLFGGLTIKDGENQN